MLPVYAWGDASLYCYIVISIGVIISISLVFFVRRAICIIYSLNKLTVIQHIILGCINKNTLTWFGWYSMILLGCYVSIYFLFIWFQYRGKRISWTHATQVLIFHDHKCYVFSQSFSCQSMKQIKTVHFVLQIIQIKMWQNKLIWWGNSLNSLYVP